MNIEQMLSTYSLSYFADTTAQGWFDLNDSSRKAGIPNGTIDARAVGGLSVPVAKGRELVTAMIENVQDAREALQRTAERLKRARLDGLLDMRAFKQEDAETQERWLACVQIVKGDYGRAVSELAHWQEYAELAAKGELPTLKDATGSGTELIRMLADSKALRPDPRLPPEHDDTEAA